MPYICGQVGSEQQNGQSSKVLLLRLNFCSLFGNYDIQLLYLHADQLALLHRMNYIYYYSSSPNEKTLFSIFFIFVRSCLRWSKGLIFTFPPFTPCNCTDLYPCPFISTTSSSCQFRS